MPKNNLKKIRQNKVRVFLTSFVIVAIVAFLGSLFTSCGVKSAWYESIKPALTPPNWVFPVVWTILFILIAFSLFYSLMKSKKRGMTALLFEINFILNIFWSMFYFGMRNPMYAFIDLILLWISILSLIIYNWKIDRRSSLLLIPYLIWVTFAGVLNSFSI